MKCPRCVQKIHRGAAICPHCGFALADADARFDGIELNLHGLTDTAGLLRRGERERVEAAMRQCGRRFPQLFIAIFTGAFGEMDELRPFGFWLLNRATFAEVPPGLTNAAGILLTIDPEAKAAALTTGYLLDAFLEEADTFDCLARAHSHWLEGRYADGMIKALAQLQWVLRKRSRQARRHPASFARKVLSPAHSPQSPRRRHADESPANAAQTAHPEEDTP